MGKWLTEIRSQDSRLEFPWFLLQNFGLEPMRVGIVEILVRFGKSNLSLLSYEHEKMVKMCEQKPRKKKNIARDGGGSKYFGLSSF